jgi:transposase
MELAPSSKQHEKLSNQTMQTRSQTQAIKNTIKRKEHDVLTRATVIAYWRRNESIRAISRDTNLPYSTVRNILVKFKETGAIENKPRCGGPKKFTADDLEDLKDSVLEDRTSRMESLSKITEKVNESRTNPVSQTTVRRALKTMGIKCSPAVVKPFVSDSNAAKRVDWCKERLDWTVSDWEKVCWSDEASVEVRGTGVRRVMVRRLEGERFHPHCIAPSFKSGRQSVMMWGCFQGNTLGPLVLCPSGKMKAKDYCGLLEDSFLPFWNNLEDDSIFMEDGAPIHTAKYSKDWRANHGITSMKWPAQSPDLNSIENLWQQLKWALEKRTTRPKNKEELLEALEEEWEILKGKNCLGKLVKSMPKRIREVIKSNGMPINY